MNIEYAVQIVWSKEDEAYLAAPAELPGCIADGSTPEEALSNLRQVIAEWVEVAKEEGRSVPRPLTKEDMEKIQKITATQFRQQIEKQVQQSVDAALQQLLPIVLSQFSQHLAAQAGSSALAWRSGIAAIHSTEELVTKHR